MSKEIDWGVKRDSDWSMWINDDESVPTPTLTNILLLDVREELKKLNRVLACPNFQRIPERLERIAKNTARKKRKPKQEGVRG